MKKFILAVLLCSFAFHVHAQSEDPDAGELLEEDAGDSETLTEPEPEPPPPPPRVRKPRPVHRARSSSSEDYFKAGWNSSRLDHGIGFNGSFLGVGNAFVYEKDLTRSRSWSFYLGYSKTADNFKNSNSTTSSGTATTSYTTTNTFSGTKNPTALSLGASYNWRLYKNSFFESRWGIFSGIDYYTATNYETGTVTSTSNTGSPGVVTVTESAHGKITVDKDPALRLGPVFDTHLFLRWFPNISVGMQGGLIYSTNLKTKTRTKTTTQTYVVTNGVAAAPTSYSQVDKTETIDTGGEGSTIAIAGEYFNLMGAFTIRYVW